MKKDESDDLKYEFETLKSELNEELREQRRRLRGLTKPKQQPKLEDTFTKALLTEDRAFIMTYFAEMRRVRERYYTINAFCREFKVLGRVKAIEVGIPPRSSDRCAKFVNAYRELFRRALSEGDTSVAHILTNKLTDF